MKLFTLNALAYDFPWYFIWTEYPPGEENLGNLKSTSAPKAGSANSRSLVRIGVLF